MQFVDRLMTREEMWELGENLPKLQQSEGQIMIRSIPYLTVHVPMEISGWLFQTLWQRRATKGQCCDLTAKCQSGCFYKVVSMTG
jgi:hypothetical protein